MPIERAAVIGAGAMGAEIAQVMAERDVAVVLKDVAPDFLERGMRHIDGVFRRRVDRGRLTAEEADRKRALVVPTLDYAAVADAQFVIEATPERLELKQRVFADLDAVVRPDALLATNTSSLSITAIGRATRRPAQVLGFHFFNPASVLSLVEVVASADTSPASVDLAVAFAAQIGKLPVRVKECPGFLVNRILFAGMTEMLRFQAETGADIRLIDAAIKERAGVPMGPFALADLIGLDVVRDISETLTSAFGERFALPESTPRLIAAGRLGQKTGAGYFGRDGAPTEEFGSGPVDPDRVSRQFMATGFLEAHRCLAEGVASADDIDTAMMAGAGWRMGPFAWAEQTGLPSVVATLDELAATVSARFAPPESLRAAALAGRSLRG
ncbi:MAG: 3-hydroxyacyl-CoA dehydrogenase [Dehalococcoidia bacterium]|nr:3-hydroxyacyl-CoA dehydrogenase [Dehalococcoidia bacterium]